MENIRWKIVESVPLSDDDFERWRSRDAWEIGEAVFLLQGYKVDQTHETVLDAAQRTHPEFYDHVRRAFLVNAIEHPEKTPAGNPCFYAEPEDWIDWASDKGLLHDHWSDGSPVSADLVKIASHIKLRFDDYKSRRAFGDWAILHDHANQITPDNQRPEFYYWFSGLVDKTPEDIKRFRWRGCRVNWHSETREYVVSMRTFHDNYLA